MAHSANDCTESENRIYAVELHTPLGRRAGRLELQRLGDALNGVLSLMKSENPVRGRISADGMCSLTGSIRTRIGVYAFEGEGISAPDRIEMLLRVKGVSLPLRGVRREE